MTIDNSEKHMTRHQTDQPAKTSIRFKGLRRYLNATKDEHNGYGYDDFVKMAGTPQEIHRHGGPIKVSLAKIFKVSRHTMTKWLEIYLEEETL